MVYPSAHGYHAALFIGGESYSGGKAMPIRMFDQWRGKWPSFATARREHRVNRDALDSVLYACLIYLLTQDFCRSYG